MAAKAVHETKGEIEKRYRFKRKLMRELLQSKKYSRIAIAATLYFIDYVLQLPDEKTEELSSELGPEIRKERRLMELYNEKTASPTVFNSFAEQLDRGIEQGVKNVAKRLIAMGKSDEEIMDATELSLEKISELRAENQ